MMATGLAVEIANLQYQRECDFNDILQKLEEAKEDAMYFIRKYTIALGKKVAEYRQSNTKWFQYRLSKNRYIGATTYTSNLLLLYVDGEDEVHERNLEDMSLNEILDIAREIQIHKYI